MCFCNPLDIDTSFCNSNKCQTALIKKGKSLTFFGHTGLEIIKKIDQIAAIRTAILAYHKAIEAYKDANVIAAFLCLGKIQDILDIHWRQKSRFGLNASEENKMSEIICRHDGFFNLYSTVLNRFRFASGITLEALEQVIEEEGGQNALERLHIRLGRVFELGHSSLAGGSLEDLLLSNRAGVNKRCLSFQECIDQFLSPVKGNDPDSVLPPYEQARLRGKQDFAAGVKVCDCPYSTDDNSQYFGWLEGWAAAGLKSPRGCRQ